MQYNSLFTGANMQVIVGGKMQFVDLGRQYNRIAYEVNERILSVLGSQQYIMGSEVQELEEKLARFVGVKHALTCSSGTDALVMALMAHNLEKKDAIFVPSFTFFASAESITLAGATPVFVDSDDVSFNISPSSLRNAIEKTIADGKLNPRGIMSVDLFGQPADYSELRDIADQYGLFVLEDACQSFGATYHGKRTGSLGHIAATSFFPAKPLGCYGDGGAVFTNSDELAETMLSIRIHGQGASKYENQRIGINGRLDTIQAAVLLTKLVVFEDELASRNRIASEYTKALCELLEIPVVLNNRSSAWAQYTIRASGNNQRCHIIEYLKGQGIPTAVYYPIPIHLSPAYSFLGYARGDLPVCELQADQVFSIPMHPYLEEKEIRDIVSALKASLR